ncbi:hypothetical protein [Marinifilum caeruleilacunae]|uniref:Uncharacterized protein n=1 Tax=Marinifilum caeruleilacunae TaxID=2499076 RepID=A0ABX1WZI9_9BACT|nr:hypothetical protein [Marinifilum caeruleilacunae]NOU61283.1 hypothetical protein [Marinifilum caeruleilacunae]
MKDIVLKGKNLKRELIIYLFCFVITTGMNIYSIVSYDTKWPELWLSLPIVFLLSIVIYALSGLFRFIYFLLKKAGVHLNILPLKK